MRNDKKTSNDPMTPAIIIAGVAILIALIVGAVALLFIRNNEDEMKADVSYTEEPDEEEASVFPWKNKDKETGSVNEGADLDDKDSTGDSNDEPDSDKNDDSSDNKNVKYTKNGELPAFYTPGKMQYYEGDMTALKEIYDYWDDYNLEAVHDLINLERNRKITDSLKGSNDFYYYGETDGQGLPAGKGLAIYANNTYYFGGWTNGQKQGNGTWLRIFPDKTGIVNGVKGVKEHSFTGVFTNDYPNGEGQENIVYEKAESNREYALLNAIGSFQDGYYNSNMYIMTVDNSGNSCDWYGSANRGVFNYVNSKEAYQGKRAILTVGDGFTTNEFDGCMWIMPKNNKGFGIAGLMKAE